MTKEPADTAVFKGAKIRKLWVENAWWFSVVDIVAALTGSDNPRDYWYKMKIREKDEAGVELSTICRQFKLTAPDGIVFRTAAFGLFFWDHFWNCPSCGYQESSELWETSE